MFAQRSYGVNHRLLPVGRDKGAATEELLEAACATRSRLWACSGKRRTSRFLHAVGIRHVECCFFLCGCGLLRGTSSGVVLAFLVVATLGRKPETWNLTIFNRKNMRMKHVVCPCSNFLEPSPFPLITSTAILKRAGP